MLRKLLAAVSLVPLALACVSFARADNVSPSEQQQFLVDQTCSQVMGLRRGETYFTACAQVLSHALPVAGAAAAPAIATADSSGIELGRNFYAVSPEVRWHRANYACARLGLVPGSASLHQCAAGLDDAFLPSQN
jgi:hypothetical protein